MPKRLVLTFAANYNSCKTFCERPEQRSRLEAALASAGGRPVGLVFRVAQEGPSAASEPVATARPAASSRQRMAEAAAHPFVRRSLELFSGNILRVDGEVGE